MECVPDDLIGHEQLPLPLRALAPRTVERLARTGQLSPVRPIRLTPRSGVFYSQAAVIAFLESKMSGSVGGVS